MLNERAGKPGHWKDRLDSLDALPGEPWTGKSAAWDKLHARLHERPRRKKLPWWWLAAAAVLLLFVAGVLLQERHAGNGLVKNKPQPVYAPPITAPAAPVHPVAPESLLVIKNNPVSTAARTAVSRPRRLPKTPSPLTAVPVTADTPATLQARIAPRADTPLLTRVAVQPKKKLQVVHINELDGQGQDDRQWTNSPSYSPKRFFRLLLINTETSSSAAAEKTGAANNRFTIKTPIKN